MTGRSLLSVAAIPTPAALALLLILLSPVERRPRPLLAQATSNPLLKLVSLPQRPLRSRSINDGEGNTIVDTPPTTDDIKEVLSDVIKNPKAPPDANVNGWHIKLQAKDRITHGVNIEERFDVFVSRSAAPEYWYSVALMINGAQENIFAPDAFALSVDPPKHLRDCGHNVLTTNTQCPIMFPDGEK